ncbi:LacI family DNA-binding transcriptional regulator [Clostridium sediminicola]|uniref:LacI family DNA-binding transcriptional regulator n=1 Tax=Clostridium sediminicola TaxID=3114879 RepID=UPI0031F2774B
MSNNKTSEKKQVTSMDVARLAGVSQTSVSRVFNPHASRKPKEEIREKVLRAAEELGYKPNAIARSLISKRTDIIAIVMGAKIGSFYSQILNKFIDKIQKNGMQILVFNIEPEDNIDNIIERVLQYQVDGLVITGGALSSDRANECERRGVPVVIFNRRVSEINVSQVYCDDFTASKEVADYLLNTGHKKFSCITGQKHLTATIHRENGFLKRLKERGINECILEHGDYSYKSGYEAAKRLLDISNRLDAIFCVNDIMGMGAIDAARLEFNIDVPEQLSIITIDDTEQAEWPGYSLTTMKRPLDLMIDDTIEILENKLKNSQMEPVSKVYKMELIKRNSVNLNKGN